MNTILSRIQRIEQLTQQRQAFSACVQFEDGTTRRLKKLADGIPLFQAAEAEQIISITGGGAGDGMLRDLLAGLIGGEQDGTRN